MWEKLEKVLDKTNYPYYRQGSITDTSKLPQTFITFWNSSTPFNSFYDEEPHSVDWTWAIYFYTTDPSIIYSLPNEFLKLAKEEGFILQQQANDIASGIEGYVGRFLIIKYKEKL